MISFTDIVRCGMLIGSICATAFWYIFELFWMLYAISASVIYCKWATWNYDESHGLMHHIAVANNAICIARSERVDLHNTVLLTIAALIHDSVDHKYGGSDYEKEAANAQLVAFLVEIVGTWDAGRIYIWITHSSYSKEKVLAENGLPSKRTLGVPSSERSYTRILADADRIEAISGDFSDGNAYINRLPMGIERCYQYTKNAYPQATEYIIWKKVCQHCEDKLCTLDNWILTTKGKELAQPGILATKQWYDHNSPRYRDN